MRVHKVKDQLYKNTLRKKVLNKKKIFNDPIYGFITISNELIFDIIEHPVFQRLRRIRQLGLTDLVYPGALHTRFHHALGAMHLMGVTLSNLRGKGHEISEREMEAAQVAILLHDIGHGPFSHALEHTLLHKVPHEKMSILIMQKLNDIFGGRLSLAIEMFEGTYNRNFFHQLISSQLDVDRLDYLQRDCFFTGVSEGTIGSDRILKMLNIADGNLVVEEKGIYSIENFLTARRLMYWQVYLHKTTVSSEKMMIQIIRRAKHLCRSEGNISGSSSLMHFLEKDISLEDFEENSKYLEAFIWLDDFDIWGAIKNWVTHSDKILAYLCRSLLERKLFRISITNSKPEKTQLAKVKKEIYNQFSIGPQEITYFLSAGMISNEAYVAKGEKINILLKNGKIVDAAIASDLPNIKAISKIVKKYYLCCPKTVYL